MHQGDFDVQLAPFKNTKKNTHKFRQTLFFTNGPGHGQPFPISSPLLVIKEAKRATH